MQTLNRITPNMKNAQTLNSLLAQMVGFELLDRVLGSDVRAVLRDALANGVVFEAGKSPLDIFRHAVATAISRIEERGRVPLFQRFLKDGPYEREGAIPEALRDKRLTDVETTTIITFIYSHMVNCFKGALTELLAVGPCLLILRTLQSEKELPADARLYVGDAVRTRQLRGSAFAKGADMHFLRELRGKHPSVQVAGVIEVKSYFQSEDKLCRQLDRHVIRARRGLRVGDSVYEPDQIKIGDDSKCLPVRIAVVPGNWPLPRSFRFETRKGRKFLYVDQPVPPEGADTVERIGPNDWRVTLRWSKEALDAAGYGMTFWFMEKMGEALYADGVPKEWSEMTPAQAGQNAATQALYYAIRRCRTAREEQRAIALYNSYGFGCALGMNFRNPEGQREMLWPQDLDEILANGMNKDGCRIV